MYIMNGIAYAPNSASAMEIVKVRTLDDWMMILTFSSGEKRLYDATQLLTSPAFAPLKDDAVFRDAKVEDGVVVWLDGEIDIAPETMYANSYAYEELPA